MDLSPIDKGKRALTDIDQEERKGASTSEHSTTNRDAARLRQRYSCDEADPSETKLVHDTPPSITFTQLLTGASCSEMDNSKDSEEEMSRSSITSCRRGRGSQVPNLDLSLLPSAHPLDFFPPTRNAAHSPQRNPFPGVPLPDWGGASPANVYAHRYKQQQPPEQLTIFYGGAVNVYNVSADMAKAIMVLASTGANMKSASTAVTPTSFAPPTPVCNMPLPIRTETSSIPSSSTVRVGQTQPPLMLKAANVPISRKNSLQRFLEKRSDRLYARAPYAPLRQN